MRRFLRIKLTYSRQIFLLTTLPLILSVAAISVIVADQSRQLAEREIAALETQLINAKRAELKNYVDLARTAFNNDYHPAGPDDEAAKLKVTQTLSSMIYGTEGYFFVFDYDGKNLVAPRQTFLIEKNWLDLTDDNGVPITKTIIDIGRQGAGYHSFDWVKPSTGETARMVVYVAGLQDWRWAYGTGIFIDDVIKTVEAARAEFEDRIRQTFVYIGAITLGALFLVFLSGLTINLRERRLADAKLKQLTQRVFDTQEEERGRVARELHDSISQMLVGVRYALDMTRRRVATGDNRAIGNLDKGIEYLKQAIQEVRRISRDLRPGVLDDLGLGPALNSLVNDFAERTGITVKFDTVVFRNRLDHQGKIALYRVAQEALTNIERHAHATHVTMKLSGHRNGASMTIRDNGRGIPEDASTKADRGLGLRNMQERIDQVDGTFKITSTRHGTEISATVPLTHMLAPEQSTEPSKDPAP